KESEINFRRDPQSEKETVNAIKRVGLDDISDQENVQVLVEDFFREIDLYDNDINLLHNRFVSPLSRIAPDFYKFFLTDTVDIDGERCVELSFTPHNTAVFGFTGQVYVPEGDTTMFVRRVVMRLPPGSNVNFIDHMYIRQDYDRASDGTRLKTRDDMTLELSILPGVQGLYARRSTRYDGHNFEQPDNVEVFNDTRQVIIPDSAYTRDDSYWAEAKGFEPAMRNENRISSLVEGMRSVPLYYWTEKVLKILVSGYVSTDRDPKKSKFDLGPVNTLISYNSVEGVRLRAGGLTTANLSPNWFGRGYVAYGCRDHKFKYNGEIEYSFIPKKYHSREFPVHSLRLSHTYDLNQIGQHYLFTNADNFVLSLKRVKDNRVTYQRDTKLLYTLENYANFAFTAELSHTRQEATKWVPFKNGYGQSFSHYQETGLTLGIRFAPGEKVYQTKSHRVSINRDAPVIQLSHTYAPASFLGNTFAINKTEFSAEKRFWFSAFGYLDGKIKGSHVWSRSPFINLLIPTANTSFTIQRESFSLMNPMEFINDTQFTWFLTYWANGLILNNIPYVKKLKLREVFSFRGVVGNLSKRNNPMHNLSLYQFPESEHSVNMNWKPYMEASVGLDNILKCLRLDYVWRLSYRNRPGVDHGGVRIAFHMTF
ncbi:MAG: carboxypeptidase-like regulatory domain-containing protein, partial [Muribaculaceae bacterium]|nr:carboxypeptidase-like regulatory domain-containing protein [Muribaculaceae bacterium]